MAYHIPNKKFERQMEKRAENNLFFANELLNREAQKEGWDNFEKTPEKHKKKILKKVAQDYKFTFGFK
jgi:hypothetical protein